MKSWRYEVRNDKHCQGWAILHLDEGGFFGVCSDFGDYAYLWSGHGTKDFREFVCGLAHDPDYTANKLCSGRGDREEFSLERTVAIIKERILETRQGGSWSQERAREEWDLVTDLAHERMSFDDWVGSTKMDDAWEMHCTTVNRQALAFVKQVLPRLIEVIKKQLETEDYK